MLKLRAIGNLLGITAALAVCAPTFSDTIHYRWTNAKGGIVYSDRPPPEGVEYEVVSASTGLKRIVDADEGAVPLDVSPDPSNEFEQVSTRSTPKEKNPVLCEKARMNLISLEKADVINVRNDKGEVVVMSDAEREIAKETAAAQISVYCE